VRVAVAHDSNRCGGDDDDDDEEVVSLVVFSGGVGGSIPYGFIQLSGMSSLLSDMACFALS
jgi:hypothetical protein